MRQTVRAMWYAKNLPTWERWARLAAAALMATCAWRFGAGPRGGLAAVVFGASALVTAVTALVGFCPMCALAGRRLGRGASSR